MKHVFDVCSAHLDDDVSEALPYLNTVLGAFSYTTDPPSLTLKSPGKLITVHPQKIAVNTAMKTAFCWPS